MRFVFSIAVLANMHAAVVLDRMAVIVAKHVIKASDIHRDLGVTGFLNRTQPDFSVGARRKAADRLIEQTLIRDEIVNGEYQWARESEAVATLNGLRRTRFGGSDAQLKNALARYGVTEDDLAAHILWQLTVLKFIDTRFRTGVMVSDEDSHKYYEKHLADLKRQYPQAATFEALEPKIRSALEGERINQNFVDWIERKRKLTNVRFLQGAFE